LGRVVTVLLAARIRLILLTPCVSSEAESGHGYRDCYNQPFHSILLCALLGFRRERRELRDGTDESATEFY